MGLYAVFSDISGSGKSNGCDYVNKGRPPKGKLCAFNENNVLTNIQRTHTEGSPTSRILHNNYRSSDSLLGNIAENRSRYFPALR